MNAADVMTRPVVTVTDDESVEQAVALMLHKHISGLPVVDRAGRLVGMVTEGDFLRRAETGTEKGHSRWLELLLGPGRLSTEYVHAHARKVAEVMTPDVVTVAEDAPLTDIVQLMERHHIKRVPVMRDGKPRGIVSRADLLRAVAAGMARLTEAPSSKDDAGLRDAILAELARQGWAPRVGVDVVVLHGVAELTGTILDERERQALRVAAENVPGIISVVDHLSWVEPMSGWVMGPPDEEVSHTGQG